MTVNPLDALPAANPMVAAAALGAVNVSVPAAPAPAQPNPFQPAMPSAAQPAAQPQFGQPNQPIAQPAAPSPEYVPREEYDHMYELITSLAAGGQNQPAVDLQAATLAQQQPVQPMMPAAQPTQPDMRLRAPVIERVAIDQSTFEKLTQSPEALAQFMYERDQRLAAGVIDHATRAASAAAQNTARAEYAQQQAIQTWMDKNPDFQSLPTEVITSAIAQTRQTFPHARWDSVLHFAGKKLQAAMKLDAQIQPSSNSVPARRFGPSASRPVREGAQPPMSPVAQAAAEMIALNNQRDPLQGFLR